MNKRNCQPKKRAEKQEETRKRIVRASSDLHRTAGPAVTTVSAVAERAGVQRLTVYRHFPNEESMIAACSAAWESQYPLPDPADWAVIGDATARMNTALLALYRYYEETADMMETILRDGPKLPAWQPAMKELAAYYGACRSVLLEAWKLDAEAQKRTGAVIGSRSGLIRGRRLPGRGLSRTMPPGS